MTPREHAFYWVMSSIVALTAGGGYAAWRSYLKPQSEAAKQHLVEHTDLATPAREMGLPNTKVRSDARDPKNTDLSATPNPSIAFRKSAGEIPPKTIHGISSRLIQFSFTHEGQWNGNCLVRVEEIPLYLGSTTLADIKRAFGSVSLGVPAAELIGSMDHYTIDKFKDVLSLEVGTNGIIQSVEAKRFAINAEITDDASPEQIYSAFRDGAKRTFAKDIALRFNDPRSKQSLTFYFLNGRCELLTFSNLDYKLFSQIERIEDAN